MSETTNKRKYRVLINGQNFWLILDGKARKMGFYTCRFVEAEDAKEAETIALELIKSNSGLSDIALDKGEDTPVLKVVEIKEVKKLRPNRSYAFYSEEDTK